MKGTSVYGLNLNHWIGRCDEFNFWESQKKKKKKKNNILYVKKEK